MSVVQRYRDRRTRTLAALGERGALVLAAAPELLVGRDAELRYVPDADLYYLTGSTDPEVVLLLCPSHDAPVTLFVRPRDAERERWTGPRLDADEVRARLGADAVHPIAELPERLPKMLAGTDVLHARLDGAPVLAAMLPSLVSAGRRRRARHGTGVRTLVEPGVLLDELRLYKDAHEVAHLRTAARITAAAFEEGRRAIRDGAGEWEVEAALEATFRRLGGSGPAFPSIVASGVNATVLHYTANERRMAEGELLLIDAGARFGMYCADVSRTYAVGEVVPERRALFDVVRAAHDAAIAAAAPGARIGNVHDAATAALAAGLTDLGLMPRGLEGSARADALRRYYPHQTSHWLGLDVHDVGDYVIGGASRRLEAGMVFTVEPGLYVPVDDESAPPVLRGVGVRIEDDVLVTTEGAEVLTGDLEVAL